MSIEEAKRQQALANEARRRGIPEWQLEAAQAVDDRLVADLVNDNRNPSGPSSIASTPSVGPEDKRGTGWAENRPLRPPEGVEILDRIMDVQDALDRRELERKLRGTGA